MHISLFFDVPCKVYTTEKEKRNMQKVYRFQEEKSCNNYLSQ